MRIQELLVEGFGDWANLQLPRFREGLNVIRVPTKDDSNLLSNCFDIALIYPQRQIPGWDTIKATQITAVFDGNDKRAITRTIKTDSRAGSNNQAQIDGSVPWPSAVRAEDLQLVLGEITDDKVLAQLAKRFLLPKQPAATQRESRRRRFNLKAERNKRRDLEAELSTLLARRAKLCEKLSAMRRPDEYLQHQNALAELIEQKRRFNARCNELREEHRIVEASVQLSDLWLRREKLQRQIKKIRPIDSDGISRLDELNNRLQKQRQLQKKTRRQLRNTKRAEVDAEKRGNPGIDAVLAQEPWLHETRQNVDQLRSRIGELAASAPSLPRTSTKPAEKVRALKPYAVALRKAQRALEDSQQRYAQLQTELDALATEQPADKTSTRDEAEYRLEQLITQREHLRREIEDLRIECRELLKRQTLPLRVLLGLAGLFAAGIAMVFAGLYLDMNGAEWASIAMGMTGAAAAAMLRVSYTRSNIQRQRIYRRRIDLLTQAIDRNKREYDAVSAGDLSSLESYFVVEGSQAESEPVNLVDQRLTVQLGALRDSVDQGQARLDRARDRWQNALRKYDLPHQLSPQEALQRFKQEAQASRQKRKDSSRTGSELARLRSELRLNEDWLEQWRTRALELLPDDRIPEGIGIDGLLSLLKRQSKATATDEQNAARSKAVEKLRQELSQSNQRMKQVSRERRRLFQQADCASESEYRQRIDESKRRQPLTRELNEIKDKIDHQLKQHPSSESIEKLLTDQKTSEMLQSCSELAGKLRDAEQQLQQCDDGVQEKQRRVRLLLQEQDAGETKLELETLETRLGKLRRSWQRQAVWCEVHTTITQRPEPEPPTHLPVRLASDHLPGLTAGRMRGLAYSTDSGQLLVQPAQGTMTSIETLPPEDRVAVKLATQLAVHQRIASKQQAVPLILKDQMLLSLDCDVSAIVQTLRSASKQSLQVFVVTADSQLVDACLAQNVPVAFVSREIDKRMQVTAPPTAAVSASISASGNEEELLLPNHHVPARQIGDQASPLIQEKVVSTAAVQPTSSQPIPVNYEVPTQQSPQNASQYGAPSAQSMTARSSFTHEQSITSPRPHTTAPQPVPFDHVGNTSTGNGETALNER